MMSDIAEYDVVRLDSGETGVIVYIHASGSAYEIELDHHPWVMTVTGHEIVEVVG